MRRACLMAAALALMACQQPTAPEIETASVAEADEPSQPEEPATEEPMSDPIEVTPEAQFQADPWTIYILDTDGEVYLSEVCTADTYDMRLRAYHLSVELYNRDEKVGHPFTVVAGDRA